MTLIDILQTMYAPMTGVSERTVTLYGYTLRSWAEFLGREPTVDDLEELRVAQFLAHRVREKAPATAAKDRAQIRAMWDFCSRRSLCKTWPAVPRIVVPERVPEAWLTEEMKRLLDSASKEPGMVYGFTMAAVFRAILLVCYDTGERISSVMELKSADVRGCNVIFRAEERKGRRRDILREISVETADALLAVHRGPDDTAIPWDKCETYIYNVLKRILKRAGLPTDRRSKFHRIRKTTASYYEAACGSGSAQRLLDHANAKTTKAYLDPRIVPAGAAAPTVLPKVV
jgi:integrase